MKLIIYIAFFLFSAVSVTAQSYEATEAIAAALKNGNSAQVARYIETTIDLSIPKSEGVFSKSQSEIILKDFFAGHPVHSFTVLHQGTSKDGSKYLIGNLTTKSGVFRTYVYLKNQSGKFFIHQLRFDPEEK